MSLYQLQKFLYVLNRDEGAQQQYRADKDALISEFDLTDEEARRCARATSGCCTCSASTARF